MDYIEVNMDVIVVEQRIFVKKEGECNAQLWHGPGHQSKTYCQVKGPHKIHRAVYGCYDQEMEWKGKKSFTGYFDEPKELS